MTQVRPIRRALISVADKSGLEPFVQDLVQQNVDIISTGGTFSKLQQADIPAIEVSSLTDFPEILSGRVKTLHPHIHAGILARRDQDEQTLQDLNIQTIDLVVVNLYPFLKTVTSADCDLLKAIENIDIGGPTMIRAAAKNQQDVVVITDPNDYEPLLNLIKEHGEVPLEWRRHFAAKAFAHTAAYDAAIAQYFKPQRQDTENTLFDEFFTPSLIKQATLRYGENPHQQAAVYQDAISTESTLANAEPIQGKPLSYNNLADADAAYQAVQSLTDSGCVIVKHANPCGMAQTDHSLQAYELAYRCDPTSAFGGVIAFNCPLDEKTCQKIIDNQFVEVLMAPEISTAGLHVLATKPNIRVLCLPNAKPTPHNWTCKRIHGGLLVQSVDCGYSEEDTLSVVTEREPTDAELNDLLFAWRSVKHVKSNAILLAKGGATLGIGAGQMSRSFSVEVAGKKAEDAGLDLAQGALASDAFFPFKDGIEKAAELGVTAIIQPGGSIRDQEVIDCANEHNITMVFTGKRHFLH